MGSDLGRPRKRGDHAVGRAVDTLHRIGATTLDVRLSGEFAEEVAPAILAWSKSCGWSLRRTVREALTLFWRQKIKGKI